MGNLFGHIGAIVGVTLWIFTLIGVVVMGVFGLIHYLKQEKVDDPGEADPGVFSGSMPPLERGEMSPYEASSIKPGLKMLIAASLGMLAIFGFSAYGLKEMAGGTKTTAQMRKEAKEMKDARQKRRARGEVGVEEEDESKKKRTKSFDITTREPGATPPKPMEEKPKKKRRRR